MEQRKRYGGNSGLGYYTSWEKSKNNGCIYCGNPATTREHVPSKAFLQEPYPDNLPTIPACFACNNGYSEDENYVACFLDILKSQVYYDYLVPEQTNFRMAKDKKLQNILQEQIKTQDDKVSYQLDKQRFDRILLKLARGHAGFESDYVDFDNTNVKIWYDFLFHLPDEILQNFESVPEADIAPEVGSRGIITPFIIQNIETGEAIGFSAWNEVQKNRYCYQVSHNKNGDITVKIVILEFLYCVVEFDT